MEEVRLRITRLSWGGGGVNGNGTIEVKILKTSDILVEKLLINKKFP